MDALDKISGQLAPSLEISGDILDIGSKLSKANAVDAIGIRRKAALEFEAKQRDIEAGQSIAGGQIRGQDIQRQTAYINSQALARAAASGAGASDPTVMHLIAQTAGEGAYRAALAMYQGEAQARVESLQASAARTEGNMDVTDSSMASKQIRHGIIPTVLSDASNLFSKYWQPLSGGEE